MDRVRLIWNKMAYKICQKVGKKIKRLRRAQKVSQEELADRAGIHRTYMGKIERGESNPPLYTIYKITKALKVSLKDFF